MNKERISQISSLTECNEFQYLLLGDLRDLLSETQDETNRKWLLAILDFLVDLMPRERRLHDDAGGYLADVLEQSPQHNRLVMSLHLRKLQLNYMLRDLRDRIVGQKSWVAVADQISCELRDWMHMLQQLSTMEASLARANQRANQQTQ